MSDWKVLFSQTMLTRGRSYFRTGKAKKLQEDDEGGYSAVVRGSRNYKVQIRTRWDEGAEWIDAMSCTCPYARDGSRCKHMAAVLYMIEDQYYPLQVRTGSKRAAASKGAAGTGNAGAGSPSAGKSSAGSPSAGKSNAGSPSTGKGGAGSPARPSGSSGSRLPDSRSSDLPANNPLARGLAGLLEEERRAIEAEAAEAENSAAGEAGPDGEAGEGGKAPLPPRHMEPYRYFRHEKFADSVRIPKGVLKKAASLAGSGELKDLKVEIGYPQRRPWEDRGRDEIIGVASVRFDNGYARASLAFDSQEILEANCGYWKCHKNPYDRRIGDPIELCEHTAALLILTREYLERENPGDATTLGGLRMLDSSSGDGTLTLSDAEDMQAPAVMIEPVVDVPLADANGERILSVSFRVGTSRMYKVKNISELVNAMKEGREMKFGKSTVIRMGEDLLTQESLVWYRFMQDALREERQRNRALSGYSGSDAYRRYGGGGGYAVGNQILDTIPLYGAALDSFYGVAEGKRLEFSIRVETGKTSWGETTSAREKQELLFCEGQMDLQVEISPWFGITVAGPGAGAGAGSGQTGTGNRSERGAESSAGSDKTGSGSADFPEGPLQCIRIYGEVPRLIDGRSASYFIDEKNSAFCRVGRAQVEKLAPLLSAARDGVIDARIGRRNLREFYQQTLPQLRQAVNVVEYGQDMIASYLPPDPAFVFYFDIEEGLVLCRPDVHYGMQIHTILDLLGGNPWSGKSLAPYRDLALEDRALSVVTRYVPQLYVELRVLVLEKEDEEGLFNLLAYGLGALMEIGEVRMTEAFRRLGLRRHMKFSVGVSVESNLMDLQILSEDLSEEELLAAFYQYQKKRKFVRLKNGDFLQLDNNETMERLLELMETMGVSLQDFVRGKMQVPAYRALYLDRMLDQMQDVYTDRDRHFKALIKEFKTVEDADYEVPASLRGVLRKYQTAGYRWLRTLDHYGFGGILADEMGLGKTLQVITVLLADKQERNEGASLVVCPASLVYNWGEELHRFAPELRVCLVTGTKRERAVLIAGYQEYDVLVTSYDLLKRDINEYEDKNFRFEIIDEAQYIKNHTTAAAKSVKLIRARTRFALTGTPIENRLSELWSIFDYLMPGFLYNYTRFHADFEQQIVKFEDQAIGERLRRMVTPFILRRRKEDVLRDLPEKLEEVRYAGMDAKQKKLYDGQVVRMRKSVKGQSEADFRKSRIQILAELTRIRQICCDPSLILENYDGGSAKREACMDLLQGVIEGEHKALVFSQFTSMLELLEADLKKAGISYYKITGATPKERRIEMVKAFNEDDTPVFLISLKAGGTGLNLTGADVVIHYDPWWNIAAQNQATDRAHRIGQTRIVTVYKLIVKGTIEERILEMQENKQKLAEDILSGENIASSAISREDLLALLD